MNLPEQDEAYLNAKGYEWSVTPIKDAGGCLVIKNYGINGEKYDHTKTDLMIQIPQQYNNAKLDMYYVDPPLKLKATNQYPQAAAHFEDHVGRKWQRFSRHLANWRPGIDGVAGFMALIHQELQNSA